MTDKTDRAVRAMVAKGLICFAAIAAVLQAGNAAAQVAGSTPASGTTSFVLPGGGRGVLGGSPHAFWLQLPGERLELRNARAVAFRSAQLLGRDTLIVLVQETDECPTRLLLLAQGQSGLRTWDVGNCRTLPKTRLGPNAVDFEVEQDGRIISYEFAEGRLKTTERAGPPQPEPKPAVAQEQEQAQEPAAEAQASKATNKPATRPRTDADAGPARRPSKPSFDKPAAKKQIRID
jgi:hypothetical protein